MIATSAGLALSVSQTLSRRVDQPSSNDLEQAVWTVPLANLKDRKHRKEGFRVPLAARAPNA